MSTELKAIKESSQIEREMRIYTGSKKVSLEIFVYKSFKESFILHEDTAEEFIEQVMLACDMAGIELKNSKENESA